jgi:hypothetical protein
MLLVCAPAIARQQPADEPSLSLPLTRCSVTHRYQPSQLESTWHTNIGAWEKDTALYCAKVKEHKDAFQRMLHTIGIMSPDGTVPHRSHVYTTLAGDQPVSAMQVFSQHVYSLRCLDGNFTVVGRIEPLVAALRHPYACCKDLTNDAHIYTNIIARNFILFDTKDNPSVYGLYPSATRHVPVRTAQRLMFDLGARTWPEGYGISQQVFLYQNYLARGITFDRHLLWEAKQATGQQIFDKVPRHLMSRYQFFNMPVNTNFSDPGHPFNVLKQLASPEDYIVMKIDIDTPEIESVLFNKIAEDDTLCDVIDELFYEPHVNFALMTPHWSGKWDRKLTMADMYTLFAKLRNKGIRMHGWP